MILYLSKNSCKCDFINYCLLHYFHVQTSDVHVTPDVTHSHLLLHCLKLKVFCHS